MSVEELRRRGHTKVGVMGFCTGASLSLLTSASSPIDAAVAFYGIFEDARPECGSCRDEASWGPMDDDATLPAGRFSAWLAEAVDPARPDVDVPCGPCTACCRSSYFIHVEPDEADTLRHIPKKLLFAAPGRPEGHKVLGFDERGHCPMLTDTGCSIYDHRPRTCRTYDCRVFTATGLSPADDGKPDIAARTRRWRFDLESEPSAVTEFEAVRRATAYLDDRRVDCFPEGGAPRTIGQRAAMAIRIHRLFLAPSDPDPHDVRATLDDE